MDITKEDFMDYETVRLSGVTNMFAVTTVGDLSGLDRDTVLYIMKHYSELKDLFGD